MPISTYWYDDEHQVIVQKFEGNWSWEELASEQAKLRTLASTVAHKIVFYNEMTRTNILPKGNILGYGRTSVANVPENVNQIIIVLNSRLIEVFAKMIFDLSSKWRNRVQFVKTIEEGQKLVAEAVAANIAHSSAS